MHKTVLILVAVFLFAALAPAQSQTVQEWGRFETAFESSRDHKDPLRDVTLEVEFTSPDGRKSTRSAFWDGGRTWRVRFSPDRTGKWTWHSRCRQDSALDKRQGRFRCAAYTGTNPLYKHGAIRVSENRRHLARADGTPFFWLVDTAWNGALRSSKKDWNRYLDNRVSKKFTGIQFVTTQWRTAYTDADGMVAYTGFEKIKINPSFFQRMDQRIDAVNAKGLLAVPVLLWTLGSQKHNPGKLPEAQAICLARYMVARYGANHVAWFLPGDGNYFGANAERWKRIGRAVFDREDHAPAMLHPQGMQWPFDAFLNENWVSVFGYQSGHGDDNNTLRWIHSGPPSEKWRQKPFRPLINLEPPYEDHIAYQSRQRHTDYTVRRAIYWSLLNAPTAGSSYGAHGVWSWETSPKEPQEHGGTGVAQPWHKAMDLPGSFQLKHLAELFTSIRWWLLRPDETFIETPQTTSVQTKLTHVVYARDNTGRATLSLDGLQQAAATVKGDFSNWDANYRLALANEMTRDRPWLGELHRIAIYNCTFGPRKMPCPPQVLYNFREGSGNIIKDVSGRGEPLNLKIANIAAVKWLPKVGLAIKEPVLITSTAPARKVIDFAGKTNAITIDVWLKPANTTQAGPARIVTLSKDTGSRNFTLGQAGGAYDVRLRTTSTSPNGEPSLSSPGGDDAARHISASRSDKGDLAVIYFPVGAEVKIKLGTLKEGLKAEWFNPRNGRRTPAQSRPQNTFRTPDEKDWVLLFRRSFIDKPLPFW